MGTASALQAVVVLQADAHRFAVGELGLDTYDEVPSEGLLGWCFVDLRLFQRGSYRVILSWSRSYLKLSLPAVHPEHCAGDLGSFTGILVLLGEFGGSCFSLMCLGLPRETNRLLPSLSALIISVQGLMADAVITAKASCREHIWVG